MGSLGSSATGSVTLLALFAAACSQNTVITTTRALDRPSDVGFGCLSADTNDAGVSALRAMPSTACVFPAGDLDAGVAPSTEVAFIVQEPLGEVSVAQLTGAVGLKDSDPQIPGTNGIPVGNQPAAIAMTPDGCFGVTANRGSCDLGFVDVLKASESLVNAVGLEDVTAMGAPLAARPATIAMPPPATPDASTCGPKPTGLAYLAYPACHMVGVVDLATGALTETIRFAKGATEGAPPIVTIGGPDITCPTECAAFGMPMPITPTGDPEPTELAFDSDGKRLFVGEWNSSYLTIVTLAGALTPAFATTVPLEGAIGLEHMAVSGDVAMGGHVIPVPPYDYADDGAGGIRRFVYAIAKDRTVHVIDVSPDRAPAECDTQVDPRRTPGYGVADEALLACFPVGDPRTPARRPGAIGPGIQLPNGGLPLDVAFLRANQAMPSTDRQPHPDLLNGVFALITAAGSIDIPPRGGVYYVTIDDDNYEDFADPVAPAKVDMVLALPHHLRDDAAQRRRATPTTGSGDTLRNLCVDSTYATSTDGPVRNDSDPTTSTTALLNNASAGAGDPGAKLAPNLHRVKCDDLHAIYETSSMMRLVNPSPPADPAEFAPLRALVFEDLERIRQERWSFTWEGSLSDQRTFTRRPGGALTVTSDAATPLILGDGGGGFCDLGAETGDIVELHGCDSDGDCNLGEQCFIHPDAPSGVVGMCLPKDKVDALAVNCKQMLISDRRYTVKGVFQGHVELAPRPNVLNETPIEGCSDDAECMAIHTRVQTEVATANMTSLVTFKFACQADPTLHMPGDAKQCIMQCPSGDDAECAPGSVCDQGRCVLGPVPTQECVSTLQTYEVFGGSSFIVLGSQTGYVHPWIVDPSGVTDECVRNPAASPLDLGRFHRVEAACTDDTLTSWSPNPCSVDLAEPVDKGPPEGIVTRTSHAIRVRNRGMRLDVADTTIPLPCNPNDPDPVIAACHPGKTYSPIPTKYSFHFDVGGGFTPRFELLSAFQPDRIRPAPDGTLWVTDSGDQGTSSGTHGQLIHVTSAATGSDGTGFN